MDEDERPVTRETTVINAGGGGGGGGMIAIIALLVLLIAGAVLYFGGYLGRSANKTDVNVNVSLPKVELPDVHIGNDRSPPPPQPATNQSGK
jgi:hypothetical protein